MSNRSVQVAPTIIRVVYKACKYHKYMNVGPMVSDIVYLLSFFDREACRKRVFHMRFL